MSTRKNAFDTEDLISLDNVTGRALRIWFLILSFMSNKTSAITRKDGLF